MALTDFWELRDHQILATKSILNVYHVKRILAGANAQSIVDAFVFSILTTNFRGMQDNTLSRTTIECENLGDETDFVNFDSSGFPGADTGDHFNNFVSAAIQFNRTRNDMKNGQKRFLMGAEGDATDGVWTGAFVAQMDLVKDTILDEWRTAAAPAVDVCAFVILKRFCVVEGQEPCLKYRLPETDVEIDGKHYVPITGLSRTRQRSQVSRKVL